MDILPSRVRGRRYAAGGPLLAIVMTLTTAFTLTSVSPSSAAGGRGGHQPPPPPSGPVVIATGLDNPRQLSFDGYDLYVAESGTGGDQGCMPGPEGDEVCFGETGSVTKVDRWGQRRVLTGLPSRAAPDGSAATGPTDVAVDHGRYAVLMGLGADPAVRAGDDVPDFAPLFGTLLGGKLWGGHHWRARHGSHGTGWRVLADVSAHESDANPDGAQVDSNPVGLARGRFGWIVADAGGNDVVHASWWGDVSTLGVFPTRLVPPPPFLPPGDIPMDAVPTSAVLGPDGALYVSQLTGFPFPDGGANIWRLVPGQAPTIYAGGLTNVTDLAWHRGRLYAVQLADDGLLAVPEGELSSGSLVRVDTGGAHQVVADGLVAPYGLALSGRSAYVTTCSVCPGAGEVVKLALPMSY
jgi:hypothetical protein